MRELGLVLFVIFTSGAFFAQENPVTPIQIISKIDVSDGNVRVKSKPFILSNYGNNSFLFQTQLGGDKASFVISLN